MTIGSTANIQQVIIKRTDQVPIGKKNNVNLHFTLPNNEKFQEGTLEVFLSNVKMNTNANDPDRNVDLDADRRGFTFRVIPDDPEHLNAPPQQNESLLINYFLDN